MLHGESKRTRFLCKRQEATLINSASGGKVDSSLLERSICDRWLSLNRIQKCRPSDRCVSHRVHSARLKTRGKICCEQQIPRLQLGRTHGINPIPGPGADTPQHGGSGLTEDKVKQWRTRATLPIRRIIMLP